MNQVKQIDLPLSHLQEKSQQAKVDNGIDGEATSVCSVLSSVVQKESKTFTKQENMKHKDHEQFTRNELKESVSKVYEKNQFDACPQEEQLHGNANGRANLKVTPCN
jgi:hypothetical protein